MLDAPVLGRRMIFPPDFWSCREKEADRELDEVLGVRGRVADVVDAGGRGENGVSGEISLGE